MPSRSRTSAAASATIAAPSAKQPSRGRRAMRELLGVLAPLTPSFWVGGGVPWLLCPLVPAGARARGLPADSAPVRVAHTTAALRLDGVPDEPAWFTTDSITDFRQTDPHPGDAATERTVVRLLAAPVGLWVGVWAYDAEPAAIRHAQLRRDGDLESDDAFTLLLDPLRDNRSGVVLAVNPNGAMVDAEVVNFETVNINWNAVWDARARVTAFGWTAELLIPWQALRYRRGTDVWGLNRGRLI